MVDTTVDNVGPIWPLLMKKTNDEFGNAMWVLQGDNVAKNSLMIMDVGTTLLAKKTNEIFGNAMWVL